MEVRPNQQTKSLYLHFFFFFEITKIEKKDFKSFLYLLCLKVATQEGICVMNIEFTLGLPLQTAYDVLSNNLDNQGYFRNIKRRGLLVFFFNLSLHDSNESDNNHLWECYLFFLWRKIYQEKLCPMMDQDRSSRWRKLWPGNSFRGPELSP